MQMASTQMVMAPCMRTKFRSADKQFAVMGTRGLLQEEEGEEGEGQRLNQCCGGLSCFPQT